MVMFVLVGISMVLFHVETSRLDGESRLQSYRYKKLTAVPRNIDRAVTRLCLGQNSIATIKHDDFKNLTKGNKMYGLYNAQRFLAKAMLVASTYDFAG